MVSKNRCKRGRIYEFYSSGIPKSDFEKFSNNLETVLNKKIVRIEQGKNQQHVILKVSSNSSIHASIILWHDSYLSDKDFNIKLGESFTDVEEVNLNISPHVFIGGGTGSGKSKLLKLILMQSIKKRAIVYISDFKGGVDFNKWWHKNSFIILDEDALDFTLKSIVNELEHRKSLFKSSNVTNLCEYNSLGNDLRRIIFACDEIAEVLDKTGLSKEQKLIVQQIEKSISVIARQGRAFGIHLILATQRPDAKILNGQIKSNINYRICGRADSILSSIILDSTDASKVISNEDQGLFVDHNGVVFKGYYFDEPK